VLGGAALAVTMIVYSCGAYGKSATSQGQPSPTPPRSETAAAASQTPSPAATKAAANVPAGIPGSATAAPPVIDAQLCTDTELMVTAVPGKTNLARGTDLFFKLFIKNTSGRTCTRDIGPDQQELYVKLGTQVIFSSDHCDGPTGTEMRSFPPGHERSYDVFWNGKSSSSCATATKRTPNGPVPEAGDYQLFGRVGTDISEPVTLKLT
jgi:hypothetical protein